MLSEVPQVRKKLPLAKLAIAAVVIAVAGLLVLRGLDYKSLIDRGMALIRGAGPWAFFSGIVVFPALGAPLSAFTIVAGEAFGARMTMPGVIAAVLLAIALNLTLTYWLARFALRPLLSRLAHRYGYEIPSVTKDNALSIALVLRLTPGTPFFVQSYLLALAQVPYKIYMIVSWLCALPWTFAFILLGKGVFKGDFKFLFYGMGTVVAASAIIHLVRRRYAKRAR
ncbi:MAG TPA: VTT domain-containing protein [Opitutaceae bacterium]